MPPIRFFEYDDHNTARIALYDFNSNKPYSSLLSEGCDEFVNTAIEEIVEDALAGGLVSSVEALLIASHFLKNGWVIPESLTTYIAGALQDAAVSFGHTDGDTEKRNAAIANSLGLIRPRGAAVKSERETKQRLVHSYVWWRMKLFDETLYAAAKNAEKAFRGTKRLSHDACEKIYNEREANLTNSQEHWGTKIDPDLSGFVVHKLCPTAHQEIAFNDDEFLKAIAPHVDADPSNKKDFLEILGL